LILKYLLILVLLLAVIGCDDNNFDPSELREKEEEFQKKEFNFLKLPQNYTKFIVEERSGDLYTFVLEKTEPRENPEDSTIPLFYYFYNIYKLNVSRSILEQVTQEPLKLYQKISYDKDCDVIDIDINQKGNIAVTSSNGVLQISGIDEFEVILSAFYDNSSGKWQLLPYPNTRGTYMPPWYGFFAIALDDNDQIWLNVHDEIFKYNSSLNSWILINDDKMEYESNLLELIDDHVLLYNGYAYLIPTYSDGFEKHALEANSSLTDGWNHHHRECNQLYLNKSKNIYLYHGSAMYLFKSTDRGNSWNQIYFMYDNRDKNRTAYANATFLGADSEERLYTYLSISNENSQDMRHSGIYYSDDEGKSWKFIIHALRNLNSFNYNGISLSKEGYIVCNHIDYTSAGYVYMVSKRPIWEYVEDIAE
jgi:hypothetical protein